MSSPLPPAHPFLAPLTLATSANLPRIGLVAAKGFCSSQVFQFERPLHALYPEDTVEDYRLAFEKRIRGERCIVVVAEDFIDEKEGEVSGEKAVVGVCCWRLPEGSRRVGEFQTHIPEQDGQDEEEGTATEWVSRDKVANRVRKVESAIAAAEARHFPPARTLIVDMLVVHPFYQRRGLGRALISWGIRLAETDHLNVGTLASNMGELLFKALGFQMVERVKVEGDEGDHVGGDDGLRRGIELEVVALWRDE